MKGLVTALVLTILPGSLWAHPGDPHTHFENADHARAEAARLLHESMAMAMESFEAGQESVLSVIHYQRLLLEAERPAGMSPIESLLALQKHVKFSEALVEVIGRRFEAGTAKQQEVLAARGNWALREADYKDGLGAASAKAVEVMKASIGAGEVKSIPLDQVKKWEGGGLAELDGKQCLIGRLVYFDREVFSGQPNIQVKAYILEEEVVKWVYEKTGIEIK
jgi:hypothetical protein